MSEEQFGACWIMFLSACLAVGASLTYHNRELDSAVKSGVLVHGDRAYVLMPTPQR